MLKKAQLISIFYFFAVVVGIILLSIVILKIVNVPLERFSAGIGNVSEDAGEQVNFIRGRFVGMWDSVIILLFLLNVIILFVSVFMIDVHPVFVILYILGLIFMFIFAPNVLYAVDNIWGSSSFSSETGSLPMTQFLFENFGLILLGIVLLSGIIMYGKFKSMGGSVGY